MIAVLEIELKKLVERYKVCLAMMKNRDRCSARCRGVRWSREFLLLGTTARSTIPYQFFIATVPLYLEIMLIAQQL